MLAFPNPGQHLRLQHMATTVDWWPSPPNTNVRSITYTIWLQLQACRQTLPQHMCPVPCCSACHMKRVWGITLVHANTLLPPTKMQDFKMSDLAAGSQLKCLNAKRLVLHLMNGKATALFSRLTAAALRQASKMQINARHLALPVCFASARRMPHSAARSAAYLEVCAKPMKSTHRNLHCQSS